MPSVPPTIRLDKWLWHARFFKTRSLATREVQAGHVRVNSRRIVKPATAVGQGDVLTFAQGDLIRAWSGCWHRACAAALPPRRRRCMTICRRRRYRGLHRPPRPRPPGLMATSTAVAAPRRKTAGFWTGHRGSVGASVRISATTALLE